MSSGKRADKSTRVNDLIRWGLNAPAYIVIADMGLGPKEVLQKLHELHLEKRWNRLSIRTIATIGKARHNWINKTMKELAEDRFNLADSLPLMVGQGLPIATFSGCIEVFDRDFILEVTTDNPVRHFTHGRTLADIKIVSNLDSDIWRFHPEYELVQALSETSKLPFDDFIVEFSVFDMPVGVKKEHVLFWEYEEINNGHTQRIGLSSACTRRIFESYIRSAAGTS